MLRTTRGSANGAFVALDDTWKPKLFRASHSHDPAMQACAGPQTMPQPPQLSWSLVAVDAGPGAEVEVFAAGALRVLAELIVGGK